MVIHLKNATPDDVGELTILAGDPDRIQLIASLFKHPKVIVENREFTLISGFWNGKKVSACSTGIGVGSTEIACIELIQLGVKCMVRVGGCGSWSPDIRQGSIIINHAMAREPGTLSSYVFDSFPAVADPILVTSMRRELKQSNFTIYTGVGLTSQSYYLGQERSPNINGPELEDIRSYWTKRGILNCDMETAIVYLLASIYGIHAANCLVVHGHRMTDEWVPDKQYQQIHLEVAKQVINSCFNALNEIYYLQQTVID
ncbi:nucleoside phosphorylase [Halalkalibacter okhensis]|uniref:Uridine phosphorylase n=1 Tax=Halalkalibacter okhensis TaxID=333138 RepID=A0A0B0I969_9BACI|nr:nucleoside phosphorylase [Halalkalibacter okhensis]KHF37810.1 uridine phosphorylase [Halalkalibacter okhensis]